MAPQKIRKKKPYTSRSEEAGIVLPVGRLHHYLKRDKHADRLSMAAPVFLAAALEYLVVDLMEMAGNAASDNKKTRKNPRHIQLAVGKDEEFKQLFKDMIIPSSSEFQEDGGRGQEEGDR